MVTLPFRIINFITLFRIIKGNNRVVVTQNGVVEEVNDYYPLRRLLSSSLSNNVQPYKYNGKELNRDNGLIGMIMGRECMMLRWEDGMQ